MLSPNQIKIEKAEETKSKGVFNISPLPKGYGHTLGNAFRRVLISSILGAAPIKVKINNVNHEFSVIEGIKEDVYNILLNIKALDIELKDEGFDEHVITISKKGTGTVTATDIKAPSNVEILNKDLVICNITSDKTSFEVEITVKNGYGYVPADTTRATSKESGVVFLDAVFSPVKFANYQVSNARLGDQTELDKLTLVVETKGTIVPYTAIKKASAILRDFYSVIADKELFVVEEKIEEPQQDQVVDEKVERAKEILIEELNLPTRTINALKKHNINSLSDLAMMDEDRLLSVRNLGEKSIEEIKKLLKKEGLNQK